MNERRQMWAVLEGLLTNPQIDLGDLVYQVRDREGLGWEGPDVTAWGNAVKAAKEMLAHFRKAVANGEFQSSDSDGQPDARPGG